jgi:hypothetical protein
VATAAQASAAPVEEVDANATPVEVLSERLRATGIDPAALNLTESREIVTYPGGSYENHLIKADFGDGITERYSVDLMLRNPQVTVVEIQRLMNQSVMSV